ncbi:MAG: IPT/TIG domain-containing protein [Bacteroidetes bacterium]|nr:IPT/TIG domain-containing protein [Bacteroidota bacterium]MCL5737618.1 IPT/TIG domain-containing protein [Bacteroidota bacterium]
MKRIFETAVELSAVLLFAVISLNVNGCKPQTTPSLYDPSQQYLPNPVVDSLSPSGSALAGIDTVTIYGKNFSSDVQQELVFFNSTIVPIVSGNANRIIIKAPATPGDSIAVRVTVNGALLYSPIVVYKLVAGISQFGNLKSPQVAYAVCEGPDSALYTAISSNGVDRGIFRTTSAGISQYAPATSGAIGWNGMKFGSGGYLYGVRGNRAIYRFAPGGGSNAQIWVTISSGLFLDMDFDPNQNLWVGGNSQYIYRITPSASIKGFPFSGNVRSVRYYNGYLYFAANVGTAPSQVFRAPVVNDSLGTPEVYFDISSDPAGGSNIYAITFSADGNMYTGTDSSDYLIVVHPGGFVEKPYSLYVTSGVLNSPCRSFAWIGTDLYAATLSGELLKIVARKQGAPYYGLQ